MKFEELTRRIVDEGLSSYGNIVIGSQMGAFNSTNIFKNDDGTFSVVYFDERASEIIGYRHIPEEEACNMVYDDLITEKKYREYKEKKNNGESVKL